MPATDRPRTGAPSPANPPAGPLAGTIVVDLSRHLPGPLAARLLADLGARVIKVEEPGAGDPVRRAPPKRLGGGGALAAMLLAGVESVALDLRQPAGAQVLARLLERADVLLETFRPGALARLGWAPEALRAAHPRLVVCSLSGWGAEGPYAARAGHDLTYQAIAGALAAVPPGRPPAVPVADLAGAWSAVAAILAALVARGRTGEGATIDAALLDAGAHANLLGWAAQAAGGGEVGEPIPLAGALPCYNLYATRDGGWLALAGLEPRFFHRFLEIAGRPDLAYLQYRDSVPARRKIASLVAERTRAEWAALLAREDLPVESVLSAAEALAHPQMVERDVVRRDADGFPRLAFPARLDGHRPRAAARVPAVGEDTGTVLEELGLPPGAGIGRPSRWRRLLGRLRRRD